MFVPSVASAQDAPWSSAWSEARAAFEAGRFTQAAEHAARAQSTVEGEVPEALEAAWRVDRAEIGCVLGLSVLAAPPADPDEAAEARYDALDRVSGHCSPRLRAVAAYLAGDPLEAALRLDGEAFPAPFAHLVLDAEALAFARATHGERLPNATGLEQAQRWVRAHAAARHGLDAECGTPSGFDWLPRRDLPMDASIEELFAEEEMDEPPPPAPFEGSALDLALIHCSYGPGVAPEDRGFGDGRSVVVYVLARRDGEVRIVGSFVGFPSLECWTGVVQAGIERVAIPGTSLIRLVDREGYVTVDDGPGFVADFTTLCDTERGGCRTVPTAYWRNELIFDEREDLETEPTVSHTEWHGELVVEGGRVHLTESRAAPRPLRRLGRPMPLARFLAAPSVAGNERALLPDADVRPVTASAEECPWEVADPDGSTNVRGTPSGRGSVVGTLESGTEVVPVERRGRWWRIASPEGWLWAPNLRQRCGPDSDATD